MYEIIKAIIDHTWVTQNAGDQQYIYYICGTLIVLFSCVLIDICYRIFSHFWRASVEIIFL